MRIFLYCALSIFGTSVFANAVFEQISKSTQEGNYSHAIENAKLYLQSHPEDGDIQFLLAKAYSLSHQESKSISLLISLLKKHPNYLEAQVLLVRLYLQQHQYGLAYQHVQQGLKNDPKHEELLKARSVVLSAVSFEPPNMGLNDLYHKGLKKDAIQKAEAYLSVYPNDADVGLILAKFYMQEGKYEKARLVLMPFIYKYPSYTDVYIQLINIDMILKRRDEARKLVHLGLMYAPWDEQLNKKNHDLILMDQTHVQKYQLIKENNTRTYSLENKGIQTFQPVTYQHEAGFLQQAYYITDRQKVWDYTSLFYGQQTKYGKLYGKLNYASRLQRQAVQFEMEYYPKINDYIYLDLDASTANQPVLFPNYAYSGEVFIVLPKLFNPSFGAQMNRINNRYQFSRFTTSISKDIGYNNLTFRPYFYLPNRGSSSTLYTLNYRYTFNEPYGNMGVILGTGTTPDLANLETVDFLVLKNKLISPYINFTLLQERLLVNMSLLYQNQIFPNQRVRDWLGGVVGATWKF